MSNPNPPVPLSPAPRWLVWVGLLALAAYGIFLHRNSAIVAGGSDSSGYLNSARLFAEGRLLEELRAPAEFGPRGTVDPMHFLPQGFFPFEDRARLTPTYPTGLPLHFALAGKLLGWTVGPVVVVLAAALGAVVLFYLVARQLGLGPWLATAGSVVLAAFPVFIFTSIQPLSDTLATAWTLATLYTALRSRESRPWAFACGVCLAIAVLVRPTNLLLAPALLVLLGFDWKKIVLFGLGGLPGAAWMAYYNHHLYGSATQSGYGDIFAAFALHYGAPTALHFVKWLALLLPTALLALPLVAWWRPGSRRREVIALSLVVGLVGGLYLFYEVSHEVWWCLRFVLPAIPAMILLGLLGLDAWAKTEKIPAVGGVLLALWAVGLSCYWTPKLTVFLMKQYEQAYADGARAARAEFPNNALLLTFAFSGTFYFYSDFTVLRWDQIEAPVFARYAELAGRAGRPTAVVVLGG